MMYCVEVDRGGIGEENCTLHYTFDHEPTQEEIRQLIEDEDIGYKDNYCRFEFYRIS